MQKVITITATVSCCSHRAVATIANTDDAAHTAVGTIQWTRGDTATQANGGTTTNPGAAVSVNLRFEVWRDSLRWQPEVQPIAVDVSVLVPQAVVLAP